MCTEPGGWCAGNSGYIRSFNLNPLEPLPLVVVRCSRNHCVIWSEKKTEIVLVQLLKSLVVQICHGYHERCDVLNTFLAHQVIGARGEVATANAMRSLAWVWSAQCWDHGLSLLNYKKIYINI